MISWERKTSLIQKKNFSCFTLSFPAKVTSVIFVSPRLILFLYFVVDNPDVISCDFESGFCGWSQSKADDADFSMNTGLLRTPTADHTPGKGLFIYITWKNDIPVYICFLQSNTMGGLYYMPDTFYYAIVCDPTGI